MIPASRMAQAALAYAGLGLAVLPLHSIGSRDKCTCGKQRCSSPGKHPRTEHGLKDATTDAASIERWWEMWPDANIGIATGAVSGIIVLDIDPRHDGDRSLEVLEREHWKLPPTVECLTGGGGRHLYFRHPAIKVPDSSGKLGPGLDVRGDGGYVLAPPSSHWSGAAYRWRLSSGIDEEVPIAPAPDWFLELVQQPSSPGRTSRSPSEWVDLIDGPITEGTRNDALTRLAGHLLRIRTLHPTIASELIHVVNEARCQPHLDFEEVERILESIAARELVRERERI